jgi:predicted DsbA family dithiol-disulfide isomerase
VLAFDCDHCYQFYRTTYPKLKKKFGNKINIVIRPIGWRGHDPGRLYFIAQRKRKGEQVMATIFDFIHEKGLGKQMYDRDMLQFVAKLNGLSNEFKTMMDDKEIVDKMNESVRWSESRNINSTPTLVIENALIVKRDYFNLVTVINALLKVPVK